nr:MAG TPA: hypothetical protein [Caudoviricetes sp.]
MRASHVISHNNHLTFDKLKYFFHKFETIISKIK